MTIIGETEATRGGIQATGRAGGTDCERKERGIVLHYEILSQYNYVL